MSCHKPNLEVRPTYLTEVRMRTAISHDPSARTRFYVFKFSRLLSRGKEKKNVISCFLISFNTPQVEFYSLNFFIFWPVNCSTLNKRRLEIWSYSWLWLLGIWFISLLALALKYFKKNSRELGIGCESLRHTQNSNPSKRNKSTSFYRSRSLFYSEYERLNKLNLLPLKYWREINDLVFFFKCLKNVCKLNILDYVSFRSCIKPLRNVDHLTLDVPFSRTEVFKNSLFVRICHLWNDLPLGIRESNTLSIFRKNLIAFYYDKFNVDFF